MKNLLFALLLGTMAQLPDSIITANDIPVIGEEIVIMPDPMITDWIYENGKPAKINITLRGKNTKGKPVRVSTVLSLGLVAQEEAKDLETIANEQKEKIKEKRAARLVVKEGSKRGTLRITRLGGITFKSLKFTVGPRVVNTFIVN